MVCSGNGICNSTDICNCNNGFDGYECEIFYNNTEYNIVYGFGLNYHGELGDGTKTQRLLPTKLSKENYLIENIYGKYFTFYFVKNYSRGLATGYNDFGQIGNNKTSEAHIPTLFTENTDIKSIAVGIGHTILLKNNGSVYSSGNNDNGQLGLGSTIQVYKTFQYFQNSTIEIAVGSSHSIIISSNFDVFSFGLNGDGQLGLGDYTNINSPKKNLILSNASKICAGYFHSMVLLQNGTVYTFGHNTYGQLGDKSLVSKPNPVPLYSNNYDIISISAGNYHSMILKSNGKVFVFGYNSEGQLGDNTLINKNIPTYLPFKNSDIIKIAAGDRTSFILKSNGQLYGFGYNPHGQLGTGSTTPINQIIPIRVATTIRGIIDIVGGSYSSFILQSNFICFGKNISDSSICSGRGICFKHDVCNCVNGYFGNECEIANCFGKNSTDLNVCSGNGKCNLNNICTCNDGYDGLECEIFYNNTQFNVVYGFGRNLYGELGDGTMTQRVLPTKMKTENHLIQNIYSGYYTNFIVKNFSKALGIGYNGHSQIGNDDTKNLVEPTSFNQNYDIKKISVGNFHVLISKNDGKALSAGRNKFGELGIGDSTILVSSTFQEIHNATADVSAGYYHSFIISNDQKLFSFGFNDNAQIGHPDLVSRYSPTEVTSIMNITKVASGYFHTLVLVQNKTVYSFGFNGHGELGDGTTTNRILPVPLASNNYDIISIAAGEYHSVILNSNGQVYLFGSNTNGQLGDGTIINRNSPTLLPFNNSNVIKIITGVSNTFLLKSNGKLYGFGANAFGQLGVGSVYATQNVPIMVSNSMGGIIDVSIGEGSTLILQSNFICFGKNVSDTSICSERGVCVKTDVCQCGMGYFGNECQFTSCFGKNSTNSTVCSNKGSCESFDKCECNSGNTGNECQFTECFGIGSNNSIVCSSHGTCNSLNNCTCLVGFTGNECQFTQCFGINSTNSNVCSGNGSCINFNTCNCTKGFVGSICEYSVCFGKNASDFAVCSGNGNCTNPNICSCNTGYSGNRCEVQPTISPITSLNPSFMCSGLFPTDPNVCNGRGDCVSNDQCICNSGFNGNQCEFVKSISCFNIQNNNSNVCSSNGICSSNNNCSCFEGYYGEQCENFDCFFELKNAPQLCSGNGNCIKPNNCSCLSGYYGLECEITNCYGLNSTDTTVCSSNGVCVGVNKCMCKEGFTGNQCQDRKNTFSSDVSCAIFGNDYIKYYHSDNSFVIEPNICSTSGWSGFSFHQKDGISTSMFISIAWYSSDGQELKIGEIKNHKTQNLQNIPTLGLISPKKINVPKFQNKQRYKIQIDDNLIKKYDYISIVCGRQSPNLNLTFPNHEMVTTRYFNISSSKRICNTLVLSGFSNRISDISETFIVSPKVSFVIVGTFWIISTLIDFILIATVPSFFTCTTQKSIFIYSLHLLINVLFGIILYGIATFDIISNIIKYFRTLKIRKTYTKCAWLKLLKDQIHDFYSKSDPYLFRFEQIIAFLLFGCYFIFEIINLNVLIFGTNNAYYYYFGQYFSTIGRSTITYLFAFYQVVLPLIETYIIIILKYLKSLKHRKFYEEFSKMLEINDLELYLSEPEFFDILFEFATIEWSQENLLAHRDIQNYKKAKTSEKKQIQAYHIHEMYLNGDSSPLEINIDSKTCREILSMINNKKLNINSFEEVEKNLKINISDTWK
eukprot:gene10521-3043_t